jgi:hypothetical protein
VHHRYQRHRGKTATGINDTGGKFATVSVTPAANFATSLASVVDTGGKFAAGINDSGGNLPPAANNGNNIRLLRP